MSRITSLVSQSSLGSHVARWLSGDEEDDELNDEIPEVDLIASLRVENTRLRAALAGNGDDDGENKAGDECLRYPTLSERPGLKLYAAYLHNLIVRRK